MNDSLIYEQISELCKERNALILAHYYTDFAIQQIAHKVGDSLELARYAYNTDKEIIVFCGVSFMGESAKLLCPDKTVLMPSGELGCAMADTVSAEDIKKLRREYPDAAFVCYVNSSVQTKALCDICCTSANAESVVRRLENERVVFVPDKNLGGYVKERVKEKEIILYDGCCPYHNAVSKEDVYAVKAKHPEAVLLVHPECQKDVRDLADFVGSTAQIIRYTEESGASEFIIGTENGVTDRLSHLFPAKSFYPIAPSFICKEMKKITKEDVLNALLYDSGEINVPEDLARAASIPLSRMLTPPSERIIL